MDDGHDFPPGTELMRNTTNHHVVESTKSHQVLLPTPSNLAHDPLNWSLKWKLIVACNQASFVFFSIIPALSIAPVTPIFISYFDASAATVSLFLGVCVITLGYANFLIIPFSNVFGRRSACLICAIITIASNIWQAEAKTTASFFGARALNGVGTAINESVMVQVIADVFFLHERGTWMGAYFASYFLGLMVGPIIAGNMAQYVGWQSFFWLCTGVSILNLLLIVFLFPETKFHRNSDSAVSEKSDHGPQKSSELIHNDSIEVLGINLGRGKPSREQWKLIQTPYPGVVASLTRDIFTPVYLLIVPITLWAALVTAGAANTLLCVNLTQSPVFASPPYLFKPGEVGFINFALIGGGVFGLLTAGPFSDWVAARMTKHNKDIREPEMRLPAMIPYFLIMCLGCIVVAVGYQNHWPWEVVVILGFACVGVQVVSLPTIAVAYAVDSYKPISGEILVICTVVKNSCGFAMSWWVPTLSPSVSIWIMLAVTGLSCLLGTPLYFFGKRLRKLTRNSTLHKMEVIM